MLHKTNGIVLNYIKYRETSIIVHIFTEKFGLQSYIVNNIRSSRARQKMSYFRPLSLLELVVYRHPSKDINRISEYKAAYIYQEAPYHPIKSAILWFLDEFLSKVLRTEAEDTRLFAFVFNSLREFDLLKDHYYNFHIQFLLKLSPYLGFHPIHSEDENYWNNKKLIISMMQHPFQNLLIDNKDTRRTLLNETIHFYMHHYENLRNLKSLEVLKEVLS